MFHFMHDIRNLRDKTEYFIAEYVCAWLVKKEYKTKRRYL